METKDRAMMALYDAGHKIDLPNGYYLKKRDENTWQVGGPLGIQSYLLGFQITSNVPVGPQGSMDSQIRQFAVAMKTHIPIS